MTGKEPVPFTLEDRGSTFLVTAGNTKFRPRNPNVALLENGYRDLGSIDVTDTREEQDDEHCETEKDVDPEYLKLYRSM